MGCGEEVKWAYLFLGYGCPGERDTLSGSGEKEGRNGGSGEKEEEEGNDVRREMGKRIRGERGADI